jgi:CheY-like chemotaxis protein/anti-sigma regulatory factor (Ser/Thr protein kinase)
MYRSSKRLLRIINDILDISKIEAGQMTLYTEEVSLNKILDHLYDFYANDLNNKKKNIKLSLSKGLDDQNSFILADPSRIEQIVINLLDNAYKFTTHGNIEFGYHLNDKMIELFVKDSGIGISEDKQKLIFERFRQVQDKLTRPKGGNGLGLSISKGLAELMGGEIWVKSKINTGSTFFVSIPHVTAKKPDQPVSSHAFPFKPLKGKVILLVEDDKCSVDYFREILGSAQVHLIHTLSGLEAIKICTEISQIDLVLMDIRLPDLNGIEVTRKIKKIRPSLPIIAQTAHAMPEDKENCLIAGCDEYTTKPIDMAYLFELLQKHLVFNNALPKENAKKNNLLQ